VPSSAFRSVPESMLGSVLENVFGVYLGVSPGLTWERKSNRLGVYNRVQSGVYFRAYLGVYNDLGACNEVHLAVWFRDC
jgi:hypothetical protein